MTTLALLGQAGISAIGIEREPSVWPHARAVHFDGEALRILQSLNLAERAMTRCKPMAEFRMENEANEILFDHQTGQLGSQGWHNDVMFHQPDMETLLRSEIEQLPTVSLRAGTTLTRLERGSDAVRCVVTDGEGSEQTLTARWVIGADGANSTVRRMLDIRTESLGSDDPWIVVDGLLEGEPGISGDMVFLGHHSRPALWGRLPGNRVRMEFKVMPGDDPEEVVTPAAIERLSHGVLPVGKFTPDRVAIYTFRARVAARWRADNVFLAGDAAHQAPPLFGQGLCAGMRDAANLVWKLSLVSRGEAGPELLDTYESERLPHARYWVEQAATMAGILQTTDTETAAQRDAYLRANPHASIPPSPALGPGLHTGDSNDLAGRLSVQPVLPDGTRLDDLVGSRFLVAAPDEFVAALPPELQAALTEDGNTVVLTDSSISAELLTAVNRRAAVLRPDRYVLGAADTHDELAKLLELIPTVKSAPVASASPLD
ncbi:hypothetical protein NJ76_28150 [Rhodococcus sp. IITR03]|nr:hypothetical protein NJ76_28150 [Rhodococcus sp. IITR03]